jgi:hypothetical protein
VVADQLVRKIPLELAVRIFSTNVIILEGRGTDIILGMRWMKVHKSLFDMSARLIHLDSPMNGKVTMQMHAVARLHASIHITIAKSLEEIPIVQEYLDMFPDELSRMLPDRDVRDAIPNATE